MSLQAVSSRRQFLGRTMSSLATGGALAAVALRPGSRAIQAAPLERALIAITLDLEMSRNFPQWEMTHWDYEKGNLDADTKAYSVEAGQRVRE
ncbi:MAG: twin-arginine translocation signal domain-containing protein, partial [Planctomycetaceae bacterium]